MVSFDYFFFVPFKVSLEQLSDEDRENNVVLISEQLQMTWRFQDDRNIPRDII